MFDESKKILYHYISSCMTNSGLKVDSDTKAEIDCIFETMEDDIRKIVNKELDKRGL